MTEKAIKALECSNSHEFKHIAKDASTLSCGHLICKECLSPVTLLRCGICGQLNTIKYEMLKRAKESLPIQYLLNTHLPTLFKNLEESCLNSFEDFKGTHSEDYLTSRIDFLKEEIDVRVESLKHELNTLREQLFKQLDKISARIKQRFNVSETNKEMKKHEELIKQVQNAQIVHQQNKEIFFTLQNSLRELNEKNSSFLRNNFDISFVPSGDSPTLSTIGEIKIPKPMDSIILDFLGQYDLFDLCNYTDKTKFKLIYRASRDGLNSNDFHRLCDGQTKTLTIIKSVDNFIFGGYTSQKWDKKSGFKNYIDEFLFSLTNPRNLPIKIDGVRNKYAIHCNSKLGPCFGDDDLYIKDDFGYSYLGNSFYMKPSLYGFKLTNEYDFAIDEIEVFKIE